MGNPLTSSERRGIVIIGAAALLIIGSGLLLGRCNGSSGNAMPESEIREIMAKDSVARSDRQAPGNRISSDTGICRKRNSTYRHDTLRGARRDKSVKTYRRRSHLDDPL